MEKIIKPSVTSIPDLRNLAENYVKWGQDFQKLLENGGKSSAFKFERSKGLYKKMRDQLSAITKEHCSFCDSYPVGDKSKETIEHYYPKNEFPLQSYDWNNLFYCCDKCQSEANKIAFQETLKPDAFDYEFSNYFYFDLQSGELKILEHLETEFPADFEKATSFLTRYGINNNPKRNLARRILYYDIKNYFIAKNVAKEEDKAEYERMRDDFMCRYVYDYYLEVHGK
jgi:uncharacterized protein (TIGR02646 family)